MVIITGLSGYGKSCLTIGVGCTGGKHRSVAVVEELTEKIVEDDYDMMVFHRDKDRV